MTGELALARHVLSAATRSWEPGSNLPSGAMLVAASTKADPILATAASGKPNASDLVVRILRASPEAS